MFIIAVIAMVANAFERGQGGVIIVPLFALLSAWVLWWLGRLTKQTEAPARSLIRIAGLLACIYLGNNAYRATLPPAELAPIGRNQIAQGSAASTEAAFFGWGGLALMIAGLLFATVRKATSLEKAFMEAVTRHVGRAPDISLFSTSTAGNLHLLMWVSERKFYCNRTPADFDATRLRSSSEIREWGIEKSQRVIKEQIGDVYTVNIALKDTAHSLLQFYCGKNKAAAFQITEALNQMAEGAVGSDGVLIS